MNCEEIKNRLSEYLDGELDERESKLVGDHLENCPGCAEELAGLKEYFKSIDSLEKAEPPPDFLRQVHARLEGQSVFKTTIKKLVFLSALKSSGSGWTGRRGDADSLYNESLS